MDLHITISGTSGSQSFTVVDDLANFLVSEFPDKVEITERPDLDAPELTQE
jgi:hypothetical protein